MPEAINPQQPLGGEFAAIINGARDVDQAADEVLTGPKPANQVATEVLDPVAAWAEIPATVGGILTMALPELKDVYNDKACTAWGKAMNALAIKRKWSADGLPPEVSVGLTSAMFVIPTVLAIKTRRAQADAIRKAREQAAGGAAAGVLPENTGLPGGDTQAP